jgi:hypothetical protein
MFLYIIPLSLIIAWCVTRTIRRMRKRKIYGKKLLVVKDITSNMDMFFGIIFLIPMIRLIMIFLQGNLDFYMMLILMWPIYLPMISIIKFTKAFAKVEIYEKGVLSRDGLWEWDSVESYSLKEGEKTVAFEFRLDRKIIKSAKITVSAMDKEKVENAINESFQVVYWK